MKKIAIPLLVLTVICSITVNFLQAKRWSDARSIVTVGGHVITRGEYISDLEAESAGSVLKNLVYRTVVMEAARKNGVLPTDSQIAQKMEEVQEKQPQLLNSSTQDGDKLAQNRADIIAAIALENLRIAGVEATDDDVQGYYSSHIRDFAIPKQVKTTLVITDDPVNTATAERLLTSGTSPGVIAMQPGLQVLGVNSAGVDMDELNPNLRSEIQNAIFSMKEGEVKTFRDDRTAYTYRIETSRDAYVPSLADIHDSVARQVELEKAPSAQTELVIAYKEVSPKFDVPKYAAYFSDVARSTNMTTASLP